MSFLKKKKTQQKARTVSQAIDMCFQFVQNDNNITINKYGRMGSDEELIVTKKGEEIFKLERRIAYHMTSRYSIKAFGISGNIDEKTECQKVNSLFDLCESKRFICHEQKTKQSLFAKIMERIRS